MTKVVTKLEGRFTPLTSTLVSTPNCEQAQQDEASVQCSKTREEDGRKYGERVSTRRTSQNVVTDVPTLGPGGFYERQNRYSSRLRMVDGGRGETLKEV
jgi:hypothetical protein